MNTKNHIIGDKVLFLYKNKVMESVVAGWNKSEELKNKHTMYKHRSLQGQEVEIVDNVIVFFECDTDGLTVEKKDCYSTKEELLKSL